jgi:hypothetical protein
MSKTFRIDPSIPGAHIVEAIGSSQFHQAVNIGIQEAVRTGKIKEGIDDFKLVAEKNGLSLRVEIDTLMEIVKIIIVEAL